MRQIMMALPAEEGTGDNSENALLLAAANGRTASVRSFLLQGVDADAADHRGLSPLMLAARNNRRETMWALIEGGADIDLQRGGTDAWPALMHAIHRGHLDAAMDLLKWGADPDASGRCGYSALMMAAGCGDQDLVAALLSHGADPGLRQPLGFTAMDYAIGYGREKIVEMLAEHDPGLCDDSQPARRAVVMLATRLGYDDILARVGASSAGAREP
jgi:serine/threonine-protein phosphatase 6 regulatory ankyrin repeat subunit B